MIEKKFVHMKKDEFTAKEFIMEQLGKGKISSVILERTPVGEKITVRTSKPGLVIGRRGEKIAELTKFLKEHFKMENPHIEISEVTNQYLDAKNVADETALALERFGSIRFKIIAYKMLERIKGAGALGAEIRLSGKLPSERAKSWRFAFGYLKKTGDVTRVVSRAEIGAQTVPGVIGVKVAIMPPDTGVTMYDKVDIKKELLVEPVEEAMETEKKQAKKNLRSKNGNNKEKRD